MFGPDTSAEAIFKALGVGPHDQVFHTGTLLTCIVSHVDITVYMSVGLSNKIFIQFEFRQTSLLDHLDIVTSKRTYWYWLGLL